MHDIWNPWHGCVKKSEGCAHCYMYFLDKQRGQNGAKIYKVKNNFNYPLQKDKNGAYKVKSGEHIRLCLTSDFFLEEADVWRSDIWKIIKARPDVEFSIITKRPERVIYLLPDDWNDGWENVFFSVTTENQKRADERIPILFDLPFKHKGVMVAPFIGPVSLKNYLSAGIIEQVIAGGENYDGSRVCKYEWVKNLYDECVNANTMFCFMETGTIFEKDGKIYRMLGKRLQSEMAYKSGLQFAGRPINIKLQMPKDLFDTDIYQKKWSKNCETCGSKLICNGCSFCGKCGQKFDNLK